MESDHTRIESADASAHAKRLKHEWQVRAASPRRDFYIASHRGWHDAAMRSEQATIDSRFILHGLSETFLSNANILEVGCGNGRLVPFITDRIRTYTGIDISSTLVQLATDTLSTHRVRFFETDGAKIPSAARDRVYDLIFAAAVFIHCPLPIIEALTADSLTVLAPNGRFRLQLLADPHDPAGIISTPLLSEATEQLRATISETAAEQASTEEADLTTNAHCYRGHVFSYSEALTFAKTMARGDLIAHTLRIDPLFIYIEFANASTATNGASNGTDTCNGSSGDQLIRSDAR